MEEEEVGSESLEQQITSCPTHLENAPPGDTGAEAGAADEPDSAEWLESCCIVVEQYHSHRKWHSRSVLDGMLRCDIIVVSLTHRRSLLSPS